MKFIKQSLALLLLVSLVASAVSCVSVKASAKDLTAGVTPAPSPSAPLGEDETVALAELYVKLFKATLDDDKGSSLISPLSIITALGMTADGAASNTLSQFEELFGMSAKELDSSLSYYYSLIRAGGENIKFSSANSIWYSDSEKLKVSEDYIARVLGAYDPELYKVDFTNRNTVDRINTWVKENTDGMIKKIVDELSPETVMALINTIVFDAKWADPYDKRQVRDGIFYAYDGAEQRVDMMYGQESRYITLDGAVGFTKSYTGGKFNFVALLPDEGDDVFDFISSLDASSLMRVLENPSYAHVVTRMPKFSYDYDILLNKALLSLGLADAFDMYKADFTDMAVYDNGEENIYVSKVIHKTHIDVDEDGTKAAAVTVVEMDKATSAGPDETKYVYVTLDRPFVYMIVDSTYNLPIFMGVVTEIEK